MTSRRAKLQEDTKFRLMQLLHDNPQISQREMAKALGISFGGINYCLNALINKGLVKIHNFSQNQNKFGYAYLLTPSGVSEKALLTGRFLKRKLQEYEALKAEIKDLQLEIETDQNQNQNQNQNHLPSNT
jgi:EPS-associated MarR family transcriptional regulator